MDRVLFVTSLPSCFSCAAAAGTKLRGFRWCSQNSHLFFQIFLGADCLSSRKGRSVTRATFPCSSTLDLCTSKWGESSTGRVKRCWEDAAVPLGGPGLSRPSGLSLECLQNRPCVAPHSSLCLDPANSDFTPAPCQVIKMKQIPTGIASVVVQLFVIKPYVKSLLFMGNLARTFNG